MNKRFLSKMPDNNYFCSTEKELWKEVLNTIIGMGFLFFCMNGWIAILIALCHMEEFFEGNWNGVCVNSMKIGVPFVIVGYLFGYLRIVFVPNNIFF